MHSDLDLNGFGVCFDRALAVTGKSLGVWVLFICQQKLVQHVGDQEILVLPWHWAFVSVIKLLYLPREILNNLSPSCIYPPIANVDTATKIIWIVYTV